MTKRKKTYSCGLEAALAVIGGKWKFLILFNLALGGTQRFGDLRRAVVGISEKMLIQELKELELDGIVIRKDYHEVPPRVDYTLTSFGRDLADATRPLCEWGSRHIKRIGSLPTQTAAE
jgi:DNA-binding HxlR family transcriptional regulator